MSLVRYSDTTTTRDTPVSQDNPLPVASGIEGSLSDAAWNGTGDPASMVALQKAIYAQLVAINANTVA